MTKPIYNAYTQDMLKNTAANLGSDTANKLYNADKSWAKQMALLDKTRIGKALNTGDVRPEDATKLVFSQLPSELSGTHRILDQTGRANARAAIVNRAMNSAVTPAVGLSPERFTNNLAKMQPQIDTFFRGDDKKQLIGLQKYIDATREAGKAGVATKTGQENYGLMQILAAAFAGPVKTAAYVAGGGLLARGYESAPVRNSLLRLASLPKGSTAFEKHVSNINKYANAAGQGYVNQQ